jgi:hypothetical protein
VASSIELMPPATISSAATLTATGERAHEPASSARERQRNRDHPGRHHFAVRPAEQFLLVRGKHHAWVDGDLMSRAEVIKEVDGDAYEDLRCIIAFADISAETGTWRKATDEITSIVIPLGRRREGSDGEAEGVRRDVQGRGVRECLPCGVGLMALKHYGKLDPVTGPIPREKFDFGTAQEMFDELCRPFAAEEIDWRIGSPMPTRPRAWRWPTWTPAP